MLCATSLRAAPLAGLFSQSDSLLREREKPMKKYKIAVLDDYQNVALESADWSVLRDRADIAVFKNHPADPEAAIERLLTFDVVCVMRERSPLPRNVGLIAFPISNSLP